MRIEELLAQDERKDLLRFVTAGSVDDGKSTLIGQLLYQSKGIYEDQLDAIRRASGRKGLAKGEFDLSFVTDGLKAEREQGITIDVAYRYFATPRRKFIIADTPGHEQYTRNMATGASTANAAIILLDAVRGVTVQSRRHAFIATLLGIGHLVVTVNKMDLAGYSREVFDRIRGEFTECLARLEASEVTFIPISALNGDNIVHHSANMPWYEGPTLLSHLETVYVASDHNLVDLRFPVQHVERTGESVRLYMGSVTSGIIRPGDDVAVLPSFTRAKVSEVRGPDGPVGEAFAPMAATVTLDRQVDVSRGNMLVHPHNVPHIGNAFDAMLIWMHATPMRLGGEYQLKHTTNTVGATVASLRYRVDVADFRRRAADTLGFNEIGRALVTTRRPLAFDPYRKNRGTGSFILIDRVTHATVAAGMILDREPDEMIRRELPAAGAARAARVERQRGQVTAEQRRQQLGHGPATVWLTGLTGSGKTTIAFELERRLFEAGRSCFVLDGENVRQGVSRDLGFAAMDRNENVRRAAEIARLFNEAGLIAICAFLSPYAADRRAAREIVGGKRFVEVYLSATPEACRGRKPELYAGADSGAIPLFPGVTAAYEPPADALALPTHEWPVDRCVEAILAALRERGVFGGAEGA